MRSSPWPLVRCYKMNHSPIDRVQVLHFVDFIISVLNKGQVMSNYYRMMNKQGGYCWMQSCATLICNTKNSDEQSIICVNYVLR